MKIACVTPFYQHSAVGDLAERTAVEMERAGHDVLLVGTGKAPLRKTALKFLPAGEFGRLDLDFMQTFDAVVYHAANDPSCAPLLWLIERVPGIVVLHDRTYAHGYDGYTRRFLGCAAYMEALAQEYYGSEGVAFVRRFRAWQTQDGDLDRFRFLHPLLQRALGVVVHFEEYAKLVQSLCDVPVTSSVWPSYERPMDVPLIGAPASDDVLLLAFVGHVSPYRCLPVLFEVLRDRPDLRARTRVAILGKVDDLAFAASLQNVAAACGLGDSVEWAFNASDEAKHALLSRAGAAYNCRSLNSEGLSWSLVEEMAYGLPAIVNADGFACEIPRDAACFVDRSDLRGGVERALTTLIERPGERRLMGERARRWVEETGSTKRYARAIVDLAERSASAGPRQSVDGRLRAFADAMGDLPGGDLEKALSLRIRELLK
jgi:glycosyltransferase involved in cell wall biosynthesis